MRTITEFLQEALSANREQFAALEEKLSAGEAFGIITKGDVIRNLEALSKKAGYRLITVFCDKINADDINGLQVGDDTAVANWARTIIDNPSKKFVLYFDHVEECDDPKTTISALMPLILKHKIANKEYDNFVFGLSVDDEKVLPKPVVARLKPLVYVEG